MDNKWSSIFFGGLAIAALGLCSCGNQGDAVTYEGMSARRSAAEARIEARIIEETNAFRARNGKSPIQFHAGLANLSRRHSDFLSKNQGKFSLHADSVSHFGFTGRSDLADQNFDLGSIAENVHATWAKEPDLAERIVNGWINSKGHRVNLLGNKFKYCGIGVRATSKGTFSTMLLAAPAEKKLPMGVGPGAL